MMNLILLTSMSSNSSATTTTRDNNAGETAGDWMGSIFQFIVQTPWSKFSRCIQPGIDQLLGADVDGRRRWRMDLIGGDE